MPRAIKTGAEREGMKKAHLLDGIALCRFLHWLDRHGTGETECAVSEILLAFRARCADFRGASFPSIACAGANAAIMHYLPRPGHDHAILPDSFFLIDSGGHYAGPQGWGTTDVTRTIWMGHAAPPANWCDQYTRVLKGLIRLSCAVFPEGTNGHRLDPLARAALWEAGLDFDHGAGHGLGSYLSVHEWPLGFTRRPVLDPIRAGMILTNEPGYYAPGSHGMRLENAMEVVQVSGMDASFCRFETMTLAPIDRRAILPDHLDARERVWLDTYHTRVWQEIGPHLDEEDAAWLAHACRPLADMPI